MYRALINSADPVQPQGDQHLALKKVFQGTAGVLESSGVFCFSVESVGDAQDFRLLPSQRYEHLERYLRNLAASHGFSAVKTIVVDNIIGTTKRNELCTGCLWIWSLWTQRAILFSPLHLSKQLKHGL